MSKIIILVITTLLLASCSIEWARYSEMRIACTDIWWKYLVDNNCCYTKENWEIKRFCDNRDVIEKSFLEYNFN